MTASVRSLRSRLWLLWALTLLTAVGVGVLLVRLYQSSATAQVQRAEAVVAHACGLVQDRFAFYAAGWNGAGSDRGSFGPDLLPVVGAALTGQAGVEGGIWSQDSGSLVYAFPTYAGTGPKTDVPDAELGTIRAVNAEAARSEQAVLRRIDAGSQDLLLASCPLPGPVGGLTAWTMARVQRNSGFDSLRAGLGLLGAMVLLIAGGVTALTAAWARHVRRLERALARHDIEELPRLAPTGERELDRVVAALNAAGERIAQARARTAELAGEVAATEQLAALGRVAAGMAHEIRNPMAAMRLRAENALAGDTARLRPALEASLEQIGRVDRLLAEMLAMTQRRSPHLERVDLRRFLAERQAAQRERADAAGVVLAADAAAGWFRFDPELIGRAVDNLLLNALQHTPAGGRITLSAQTDAGGLELRVADTGAGIDPALRRRLFEPFATGRPDGTGLGLAIAREMAEAHGGQLRLMESAGPGAVFALELPAP